MDVVVMVVLEIAPLLRRNQSTAIIKGSFGEWIAQFRLALPLSPSPKISHLP